MKKTIIGGIFMLSGVLTSLCIIMAAAFYSTSITSWSGTKLWFVIFGSQQYGNETVQSLFLGFPFVIGILLFVIGLIILGKEYYSKEK